MEKNPRDYLGRVPLHLAVNNKNLRICKLIYEKGHPLDPRSNDGNILLHDAASKGYLCVFKYLFELVEEKNPQGYKGYMPIHRAAKKAIFQYSNLYMKNLRTKIRKITEVGCQFIMLPVLSS